MPWRRNIHARAHRDELLRQACKARRSADGMARLWNSRWRVLARGYKESRALCTFLHHSVSALSLCARQPATRCARELRDVLC